MSAVAEVEGELKYLARMKSINNFTLKKLLTISRIEINFKKLIPIKCGGKASSGLQKGHSYVSSAHFSASDSF